MGGLGLFWGFLGGLGLLEFLGLLGLLVFLGLLGFRDLRKYAYMMQGCHTPPPPPPPHGIPPAPPVGWGLWWCLSPPLLWFRCCGGLYPWALFAVVPAAGGTAHDVVLQTATRVDNRIIFDIMLNIIIVVVIFIISTIKEQLPPPS